MSADLPTKADSDSRWGKGLVLVAEDDAVMRSMLSDILVRAGFAVLIARDGGEALEVAARQPLDLVVLDVMMPVHDGFEVCGRLKEAARREARMLPILLLTALDTRDARLQGLGMGADDYVTKPFGIEELVLRVHGLISNKRSFDELARRYHEVERIGEMQRKLAAFLVHDFKNPLSALEANLELLQRLASGKLEPRTQGFLNDAAACSRRLFNLVNTLLDVYRMEEQGLKLQRRPLLVEESLRSCAAQFESLARLKGLRLEVALETPGLSCEADPALLQRVLGNLVTNAVRYTPRGKRVVLSAAFDERSGAVRLAVEDEASRISPEHRELIFEKFGRVETADALPGHGLGLTFCRLVLKAHGGQIWVEDGAEGNRFAFTLPVSRPAL
ncbi:MAG: hybrid sensor histidine kinase/response regulator [Deltaproteobacteria bacterium]|nr:hybrid sensor histidine kinase/response regulator [Deltaproteobacteria bacterium]